MMLTASVEACSVVLHHSSSDGILEGFVEFAEAPDDEVDEVIDIDIGLLLIIDGLDILLGLLLSNTKQGIDSIIHNLHDLFRDKFFLSKSKITSP